MPGIAGIITPHQTVQSMPLLDAMLGSMMNETFYRRASHVDRSRGWYCGRVSLEGSFGERTPVANATGDLALLVAGECLFGRGNGGTDPAAELVRLYEEHGLDFVRRLNGLFSGVILDSRSDRVVLFNDRYGLERLYYYEDAGAFYFASEVKALLQAVPALRAMDPYSVAEYLCYECVLNHRSYFQKVRIVPGGSVWVFTRAGIEQRLYSEPGKLESLPPLPRAEFSARLGETFRRILPRYLEGRRIAIGLTGGLDTRLIMTCLPAERSQLAAFTFGGRYRDSSDLRIARKVCALTHVSHGTIRLDGDFLARYPDHASRAVYVTDGLSDATNLDSVYLSQQVRQVAPIMLLGTFGSQVLGRVRRALRYRLPHPRLINPDFQPFLAEAAEALKAYDQEHPLTYLMRREIPWYWSRFYAPQMAQLTLRSPFLDNDFFDLMYQAPPEGFDGSEFELSLIAKVGPDLLSIRTNKGRGGRAPWPLSLVLQNLIAARATADKALNWDVLPHSLHHVVSWVDARILSPLQLDRLFLGFENFRHYNRWFRRELAPYLREMLFDPRTLSRPYWNRDFIVKMVEDHVRGRRRYLPEIRKVLTLELVHRVLLEDSA